MGYDHIKRGKRQINGREYFFRSEAEAMVAHALLAMKWAWEYEPTEFEFPLKRGIRFFRPDFRAWPEASPEEWHWMEVKGYWNRESKTKLRRFARYYPQEAGRLIIVTDARKTAEELLSEPCFVRLAKCPEVWSLQKLRRLLAGGSL